MPQRNLKREIGCGSERNATCDLNCRWCRKNSPGRISSLVHKMSVISTSCAQRSSVFALARCASQAAFFRTHSKTIHGYLVQKLSTAAARMVSVLRAAVRWRRALSRAERLSAGVVPEFALLLRGNRSGLGICRTTGSCGASRMRGRGSSSKRKLTRFSACSSARARQLTVCAGSTIRRLSRSTTNRY